MTTITLNPNDVLNTNDDLRDPLLQHAKDASNKQGFVTISHIQRMLKIGYPRAARLVDLMIEDGFCGKYYIPDTFRRKIIHNLEGVK